MHDNKQNLTIWEINSSKFNLLPLQVLLYFVGLHKDDLAPSDGQGSEIAYRQGNNIYFNDEYPFIAVPSSGSSSSISLLWVRHNIQKLLKLTKTIYSTTKINIYNGCGCGSCYSFKAS